MISAKTLYLLICQTSLVIWSLDQKNWWCLSALAGPFFNSIPSNTHPLLQYGVHSCTSRWGRLGACRAIACFPQSTPHTLTCNMNFLPWERGIPDIAFSWEYTGTFDTAHMLEWPAGQGHRVNINFPFFLDPQIAKLKSSPNFLLYGS